MLRDAKLHQRTIVISLLDLKNAFGEISHNLIASAMRYHHIPETFIAFILNIYKHSQVAVSTGKDVTEFIDVKRGVLQEDPISPLLFNVCFNLLIRTITQPKFAQLGYIWGPNVDPFSTSCLQFADDSVIVSRDVKSAQTLINLYISWCNWAEMEARIDKCQSYGARKLDGMYTQFCPNLTIMDAPVPSVEIGGSFKYLGKVFSFNQNDEPAKFTLKTRLKELLDKTSSLEISPQMKLKVLRLYIPSQISFGLRIYNMSYTWIGQNLDALCINAVNDWLEMPRNTCTKEILELPRNKGGHDMCLPSTMAMKLRLSLRYNLQNNVNDDLRKIWQATFSEEPQIDGLVSGHENKQAALKELRTKTNTKNLDHVFGLKSQGRIFVTIIATFSKTTIKEWSAHVDSLPDHLFRFVRKACQQQLPTASNLQLWKKVPSDKCILCGARQTNKHVLNNCSAAGVLERYKRRHDHVLSILAQWIKDRVGIESVLFADLSNSNFKSPAEIFNSRRPDIVVQQNNRLVTLELTICHETNAATSRDYKMSKYMDLKNELLPGFANFKLTNHTIEITSLGFISDSAAFTKQINIDPMPGSIKQSLFKSTVSDSYSIYCSRNSLDS